MLQQVIPHHISQKLTKLSPTNFKPLLKKCENENVDSNLWVRKLDNVFLNTQ
jgi:hypothetical protein